MGGRDGLERPESVSLLHLRGPRGPSALQVEQSVQPATDLHDPGDQGPHGEPGEGTQKAREESNYPLFVREEAPEQYDEQPESVENGREDRL